MVKLKLTDKTVQVINGEKLSKVIENNQYVKLANKKLNNKIYEVYIVKTQEKGEDPVYSYILFDFVDSLPYDFKDNIKKLMSVEDSLKKVYGKNENHTDKYRNVYTVLDEIENLLNKESLNVHLATGFIPVSLDNEFSSYQECENFVLNIWDGVDVEDIDLSGIPVPVDDIEDQEIIEVSSEQEIIDELTEISEDDEDNLAQKDDIDDKLSNRIMFEDVIEEENDTVSDDIIGESIGVQIYNEDDIKKLREDITATNTGNLFKYTKGI